MTTRRLTPNEATAFARKLEDWAQGLPSNERAFLDEILARAVSTVQPDVQGYFTLIELTPLGAYEDAAGQIAQAGDGSV